MSRFWNTASAVPLYQSALEGFTGHAPERPRILLHLVQCLDRLGRSEDAAVVLQQALVEWPQDLELILEAVRRLQAQGDTQAALTWRRRALSLLPTQGAALRRLAWQALELGASELIEAAVDRLSQHAGGDAEQMVLIALGHLHLGQVDCARIWGERAMAMAPGLSLAWHLQSQLYRKQRRLVDALQAARHALRLAPHHRDNLRQLGWICMELYQFRRAQRWFRLASRQAPHDPVPVLEQAQAARRAGRFAEALAILQPWLMSAPVSPAVLFAWSSTLLEAGDPRASAAGARLLRAYPKASEAAEWALRAVALGWQLPAGLLEQHPADRLHVLYCAVVENSTHVHGQAALHRLADWAERWLDPEPRLALSGLYIASLQDEGRADALARQARITLRMSRLRAGVCLSPPRPTAQPQGPVRIAYVCGQHHAQLLRPVWTAHAAEQTEIFVFTAHPLGDLPPHVHVEPLVPQQLAQDCARLGIDVVIDTGGLHPLEGQADILLAYARRVAPVQLGWLGCWGPAGGFFDALLSDAVAIPEDAEPFFEEAVLRLEGGAWCWEPPPAAKQPTASPAERCGYVTFGVTSRGLRLGGGCVDTMARIVAATPGAEIRFIGRIAEDWPHRREILARMQAQGVADSRVFFDVSRQSDYLDWFDDIDIVLDSFPSNGGLSLLEPLWMGVPVVTLAGAWAGARQGASILGNAGLEQLVAGNAELFVTLAVTLATDYAALRRHRRELRQQLQDSPLLQGRRVASQIENLCSQLRDRGVPGMADRRREVSDTSGSSVPDVTVVLRHPRPEVWSALEDQRGVRFEMRGNADEARGRHIAFLDDAAVLQDGALAAAVAALDANHAIGALGGRVVRADGRLLEAGRVLSRNGQNAGIGYGEDPFDSAAMVLRQVDCVSTLLVTPAAVWRELGGGDDADYCLRVRQSGRQVVCDPAVLLQYLGEDRTRVGQAQPLTLAQAHGRPRGLPRVLMIDNEVPHMVRGGGLPRARLMLQALADWQVTLFPLWLTRDRWRAVYASVPRTVEVALGHGLDGLKQFLEDRRGLYDVLLVSRPPNLAALAPLRERRPDLFETMRLVYDAEALFALRESMQAEVAGRPYGAAEAAARVVQEVAMADGASDVLVVSGIDASHFRQAGHRTHILSHAIAPRFSAAGARGRSGLLFVGALHPGTPNEDGLLWFIREVLPRLNAQCSESPGLTIVGVCLSEAVAALANAQIRVMGAQDALDAHYDGARVFIAPVRYAGGVPAKVIEAAAHGLPVVASSLLVQQLGWQEGRDILGAVDAQAFAGHLARLLQDDEAWQDQQRSAWKVCRERYDPEIFGATLRRVLCGEG